MARRRSVATEEVDVMRLLIDPLFGFVGAVMSIFLVQVILSMNMINPDLEKKVNDLSGRVQGAQVIEEKNKALGQGFRACQDDGKLLRDQLGNCRQESEQTAKSYIVCKVAKEECARKHGDEPPALANEKELCETCKTAGAGSVALVTSVIPASLVGQSYSLVLAAEGGVRPYHWSITGGLPEGFQLDADRGVITGTPKAAGKTEIDVTVRDSSKEVSSSHRTLPFDVLEAGVAPETHLPWWAWALVTVPAILWVIGRIRWEIFRRAHMHKHVTFEVT